MCIYINTLDVLQLHCIFPYMYTEISSQASQGSWAHIYTRSSSSCGRKIFLFNAAVQFFFAVCLWIRVRQRVMWSWQQRRLLLRDSHFSFSPAVFFPLYCQCYWPLVGIWIFKRHFISLSCSYSQGKGGKSCTVFLFYPPEFGPADDFGSSFYISPLCLLLSSHVTLLLNAWSYSGRLKSWNTELKTVLRIYFFFSRFLLVSRNYKA